MFKVTRWTPSSHNTSMVWLGACPCSYLGSKVDSDRQGTCLLPHEGCLKGRKKDSKSTHMQIYASGFLLSTNTERSPGHCLPQTAPHLVGEAKGQWSLVVQQGTTECSM